jgi:uncharacterized protein YjbI with pentapeptide repeats
MEYSNKSIKILLAADKISKEQYDILFENKMSYNSEEIDNFNKILQIIIRLEDQIQAKTINLNSISFPNFEFKKFSWPQDKTISFLNSIFYGSVHFGNHTIPNRLNFNKVIFKENAYLKDTIFLDNVSFNYTSFNDFVYFNKSTFVMSVSFRKSIFEKNAYFSKTTFQQDCNFYKTIFQNELNIKEAKIHKKANFWGAKFEKLADFSECSFHKINFINIKLNDANFLHLSSLVNDVKVLLNKDNFENRESARLIKAHFEKQNNITEANKYFQIEQDLYIDELKDKESIEPNKLATKFVLYLNKFVSNFGTDWIRPLLVMFIFGFFASFFYIVFSSTPTILNTSKDILFWTGGGFAVSIVIYLLYHYKEWKFLTFTVISYIGLLYFSQDFRLISNDISKLVNPLNIFKSKDYFEYIAPYGMIVKLIMSTLIYQFIMAFRQNTRRK